MKENLSCPSCGSEDITSRKKVISFPYGEPGKAVSLEANVGIHKCEKCGLEFLDEKAEEEKTDAICCYLGRTRPSQVRTIRRIGGKIPGGWTQAEFAKVMGVDEATIDKWERGIEIPNETCSQLLFLLSDWRNRDLLCPRHVPEKL